MHVWTVTETGSNFPGVLLEYKVYIPSDLTKVTNGLCVHGDPFLRGYECEDTKLGQPIFLVLIINAVRVIRQHKLFAHCKVSKNKHVNNTLQFRLALKRGPISTRTITL